jgi:hypothetical protein
MFCVVWKSCRSPLTRALYDRWDPTLELDTLVCSNPVRADARGCKRSQRLTGIDSWHIKILLPVHTSNSVVFHFLELSFAVDRLSTAQEL